MPQACSRSFSIHSTLGTVHIRGNITQDLRVDVHRPLHNLLLHPTARSLDLLNIAAGVYAVDRAIRRKAIDGNETGIRTLHLDFAVHDLDFWQTTEITESVTRILCFLTDENWSLRFVRAEADRQPTQPQSRFDFPWKTCPRRIALFSGGLDSAAGLANRVLAGTHDFLLLTVGHHNRLRGHCIGQIAQLSQQTGTPRQMHMTLDVQQISGVASRMSKQELSQRSRAFLFTAAAAAVAQTCKVSDIEVFENGVGAINFPLMTGMLTGGLATRGAHPTFLKWMSELASSVVDQPIRYTLPFFKKTKAEMLLPLRQHGLSDWLQRSRSCVHTSLRQRKVSHCGQCAGCIERRQAFSSAGINERIEGVYSDDLLTDPPLTSDNADYLQRYIDEAANWLSGDDAIRRRLAQHLRLTNVPAMQYTAIARQQRRHAQEVIDKLGHLTARRISKGAVSSRRAPALLLSETSP